MRRIRIYYQGELTSGLTVMLDANSSHHLAQVLRKKAGDHFYIFNGKGGEFEATLISVTKKTAAVKVGVFHELSTESDLQIHLGQGISRAERMDYAIQKAVELGVTEITPLFTEFCQVQLSENRVEKRVAHWQAIATSAVEQSSRYRVPIIHTPMKFSEWLKKIVGLKLICCPRQLSQENHLDSPFEKGGKQQVELAAGGFNKKNISVAIGPEGGFSDREITESLEKNCKIFSLGPRILRTETATVVALTLLQQKYGDL